MYDRSAISRDIPVRDRLQFRSSIAWGEKSKERDRKSSMMLDKVSAGVKRRRNYMPEDERGFEMFR